MWVCPRHWRTRVVPVFNTTRIDGKRAFLELSCEGLEASPQRSARTAVGALLQLMGEGSDQQIATEAQRRSGAMQFAPGKPQIVCRPIDQCSNFDVNRGPTRLSCSIVPLAASTGNGRRLASVLASRSKLCASSSANRAW